MVAKKRWLMLLAAALLLVGASCSGNTLDDGSSADVFMEVVSFENAPVTASLDDVSGACTFTVAEWTATIANQPKNELAGLSALNDIVLTDVVIAYAFLNPAIVVPTRTIGLANVVAQVGGSGAVTFSPISFDDLTATMAGTTSNLTMTFNGFTVEGTAVSMTATTQMFIEGCV